MLECIAVALAAFMIPAAPMNTILPENYSHYRETAYVLQANDDTSYVYTPNGSPVEVYHMNKDGVDEPNIDFYTYYFVGGGEGKYSGYYENSDGKSVTLMNKGISRVGDPTTLYNFLSYAFYMYWEPKYQTFWTDIACVIYDYSPYLNDYSYDVVGEPQANDIIIYYHDEDPITAGIVQEVYSSEASNPSSNSPLARQLSKLKVRTKWDKFGVYEHRGDYSPYMPGYATSEVTLYEANNVKYFRRHTHSYTQRYIANDATYHKSYCVCGEYKLNPHIWIRFSGRQKYCQDCGYVTGNNFLSLGDTDIYDFKKHIDC